MRNIYERKTYFAWLFSVIILFAIMIILKIPLYKDVKDLPFYTITSMSLLPAYLYFSSRGSFIKRVIIAYTPATVGFLLSMIFKNSLYFLISFPIFLLNFLIIFPRSKDG